MAQGWTAVVSIVVILVLPLIQCLKIAAPSSPQSTTPRIQIEDWMQAGEVDWEAKAEGLTLDPDFLTVDGNRYFISEYVVGLVVSCQAKYPVEWHSDVGEVMALSDLMLINGKVIRDAEDVFDPKTFTYTNYLMFRGHIKAMTGRYTCQKVGDSIVSSSVYMFWEGPPPYLVLAPRSLEIQAPRRADKLLFPCYPATPNATVNLYKSVLDMFYMENYFKVKSEYIEFDPTKGIYLNLKQWTDVPGDYKCATNDSSDYVDFTVTQGLIDSPVRRSHVDVIERNASFSYSSKTGALICCSASGQQPTLNTVICNSPTMCGLLGDGLFDYNKKIFNSGMPMRGTSVKGSCMSMHLFPGMMGHFQCVGDGVDIVRTLYTSYPNQNGTFTIFTSWDKIKPTEMVKLRIEENLVDAPWVRRRGGRGGRYGIMPVSRGGRRYRYRPYRPHRGNYTEEIPRTIYSGESITFRCLAPSSYFAHGSKFVIRWNNQTLEQIPTTETRPSLAGFSGFVADWKKYARFASIATTTTLIHSNMSAIICYAPVYNSTAWVKKELQIKAKEPTAPMFATGDGVETFRWTLNDTNQELRCAVEGEPMPNVTLFLNDKPVKNSSHVTVIYLNATVIMRVPKVFHDFHGEYTCVAYNLGGAVEKKFVIFVDEPKHTAWIAALITVVSIGVITGLVCAGWKLWQRRRLT